MLEEMIMPVPLKKHSKIWVHPDGIIPEKIYNRLLFQREIRPDDKLTLFVTQNCLTGSKDKIEGLESKGVKIKVIEQELSERNDDPYLVAFINNILEKVKLTKNVEDSVFASDFLRMTNMVQNEGLYSDTDVLFLNNDDSDVISTTHLFGHHNDPSITDIHIFGLDSYTREKFHQNLVENLRNYYGDPISWKDSPPDMMPGMHFLQFLSIKDHGHLDFTETHENVFSGLDQSHSGGEEKLRNTLIEDEFLNQAKAVVEMIKEEKNNLINS